MKKKNIIYVAICAVIVAGICAGIYGIKRSEKENIKETETQTAEDLTNVMLTQKDGKSENFYQGNETEKVIVNTGKIQVDVTDDIIEWAFGFPVLNLNSVAAKLDLEIDETYKYNNGKNKTNQIEIYAPEEKIDLEKRFPVYIYGTDESFVKYKTTSGFMYSPEMEYASQSDASSSYHMTKTEDGIYKITANMLPYIDQDGHVIAPTRHLVEYKENGEMVITLKP